MSGHHGPEAPPIRVLLAVAEPVLLAGLRALVDGDDGLEMAGIAADANEAAAKAREFQPDVALLDAGMPKGGGPPVARRICGASPATRVLALAADEDQPTVVEMLRAGAVGFLLTGDRLDEIREAISRAVRGRASLSASVLVDVVGEMVDDIADRLERERGLIESEQRLRDLLDSAPDAVVMVNADGRILLVNGEVERMFGYAAADLMGRSVELLLPEHRRAAHVGQRDGFLAAPRARAMGVDLELAGRHMDGSEFPVLISLSSFETDDGRVATAFIREAGGR